MTTEELTALAQKLEEALALMQSPVQLLKAPHGRDLWTTWRQITAAQLKVLKIRDAQAKKKA